MKMLNICFFITFSLVLSCAKVAIKIGQELGGAWKVVEIRVKTTDKEFINSQPQPGLFLFTQNHYSMVWMPGDDPPKDFAHTWHPSDEEKVKSFNSIIVNSGTYQYTDSTLTTIPAVAKTPEFINGSATYSYQLKKDTLYMKLIDTYSHDGIMDEGVVYYQSSLKLYRQE